jgi:diaminohydroxyphosphoribosylaminopyrimidine deaminase/5-amino-6-(5-phosphoribosylamino)uracil reductase
VIIEGGGQTLQSFIDTNLWDEARVFVGDIFLKQGIEAPVLSGKLISEKSIKQDILKIYLND